MVKIAIDAMGGDNAPDAILRGTAAALEKYKDVEIVLFGPEQLLKEKLSSYSYDESRLSIEDAPDVISLHESPVLAIRRKKNSSIVRALDYVRDGKAQAFLSGGSSGAILAGGQLIIGRLHGIYRPPLGCLIPTKKDVCLLIDCGANVDAKPEWLLQFAEMGSIYFRDMLHVKSPTVGLLNIGAEEEKGNQLVKETMPRLKEAEGLNFIGSVEARDVVEGDCNVVVTDAFSGNILLKMYEGTGKMFMEEVVNALKNSGPAALLGAGLIRKPLKNALRKFDAKRYGGAPILGLKGLVVKIHGNTDGRDLVYAVDQCRHFISMGIVESIAREVAEKERMKDSSEEQSFAASSAEQEQKHEQS